MTTPSVSDETLALDEKALHEAARKLRRFHHEARYPGVVEHDEGAFVLLSDLPDFIRTYIAHSRRAEPSPAAGAGGRMVTVPPHYRFQATFHDAGDGKTVLSEVYDLTGEPLRLESGQTIGEILRQQSATPPSGARSGVAMEELDALIEANVIGGTDDHPAINRAALLGDLAAALATPAPVQPEGPTAATRGLMAIEAKAEQRFEEQFRSPSPPISSGGR